MSDILDKILATKREEVAAARKAESLEAVREAARDVLVALRPDLREFAGFYRIGSVDIRN